MLLDDSGADLRTVANLAWQALPAWILPARQLHDPPARMRASLATVLMAWMVLTGLALVFAQLTEAQGLRPAGHPIVGWSYWVFDGAMLVSVLVVAAGGLPLWLLMMRRAYREHRPRDIAYLLSPVVVPAGYLAAVILTARLIRDADGVGPWWFLAFVAAGFAGQRRLRRRTRAGFAQALPARSCRSAGRGRGRRRGGGHQPGRGGQHCRRGRPLPLGTAVRRLSRGLAASDIPSDGPASRLRRHGQRCPRHQGHAVGCCRLTGRAAADTAVLAGLPG